MQKLPLGLHRGETPGVLSHTYDKTGRTLHHISVSDAFRLRPLKQRSVPSGPQSREHQTASGQGERNSLDSRRSEPFCFQSGMCAALVETGFHGHLEE